MPLIRISLTVPSTRCWVSVVVFMIVKVIIDVKAGIDTWNTPYVHMVVIVLLVFPLASDLLFLGLLGLMYLVVTLRLIHAVLVLHLLLLLILLGKVLFLLRFLAIF